MDYTPRASFVPYFIPPFLGALFNYFVSLSAALALLNMVPAYQLDGQWVTRNDTYSKQQELIKDVALQAFESMMDYLCARKMISPVTRSIAVKVVLRLCSLLLVANVAVALLKMM